MIMVMLGGLTMWIDPKSVPARVSMAKQLNNAPRMHFGTVLKDSLGMILVR